MAITEDRLPWLIDINVFMTPISQTNFNTVAVNTESIRCGYLGSSGAQNDEANWDVVLAKGTWTIELLHTTAAAYGIYSVQLDGVEVGTIDGYASPTVRSVRGSVTNVNVTATGKKRLKLKMATKNASASAYYAALQHIQLRRNA